MLLKAKEDLKKYAECTQRETITVLKRKLEMQLLEASHFRNEEINALRSLAIYTRVTQLVTKLES